MFEDGDTIGTVRNKKFRQGVRSVSIYEEFQEDNFIFLAFYKFFEFTCLYVHRRMSFHLIMRLLA